jgi:hypothetical protein
MAKYVLLLREDHPGQFTPSPEEIQAMIVRYRAWSQKVAAAGKLEGGQKLTDEGGRHLRLDGGKLAVQDGPYAEAREVLGGFYIVQAADYDEAVALAGSCPHLDFGWIEVRQVDELPPAPAAS